WVDIHMAAPQLAAIGQFIDIDEQRELASSHDAFLQEFCCQFLSAAEMWLPLELIAAAGSPLATANWDPNQPVNGDLYFGADIGRRRDRTAIWIDQSTNGVAICRGLILLDRTPFEQQYEIFCGLLQNPCLKRGAIDQTGLGLPLVERLQHKFGGARVEGVDFTLATKESMSVRVRERFEKRLDLIPEHHDEIQRDLTSIKRIATSSSNHLRFDADRTESSHADIYWAKALADLAAERPRSSLTRDGFMIGTPRHPLLRPPEPGWINK